MVLEVILKVMFDTLSLCLINKLQLSITYIL
jgi:hypothetical protein